MICNCYKDALKRPLLLMVVMYSFSGSGWADKHRTIEDFYGEFVGHASTANYSGERDRDMSISIRPAKQEGHFIIKWSTVVHKADGRSKRKVYQIRFASTDRHQIYSSAMKTNVFGGMEAMNPLKGDPFVWARIKGETLTVHALIITEDGDYEMQTYDRTLNKKGLWVDFSRRDRHDNIRKISTQLVKVSD
ncbi:MAG: hypothetical protein OQK12_03305 [Motiliproteus sp.]|nr:hypothetical protein [Motiliproteus sp.]MCW9051943.1 hypothetical protein [Motiliproteus sp.]